VQGPYRVLENAGATFMLRIGTEDVRVSSDRVTSAPRRELPQPLEGNPTSSDPVPPAPVDGTPSSPPIYRSEGQPRRPGKREVRFDAQRQRPRKRPEDPLIRAVPRRREILWWRSWWNLGKRPTEHDYTG
jgi:hypothetical protein